MQDVDRHQLRVEGEDPLALGRVQVHALGAVDGDRVDRALDRPREDRVLAREGNDLLARHAGRGADAHRSSSVAGARLGAGGCGKWRGGNYSTATPGWTDVRAGEAQPSGIASAARRIAAMPSSA